MELLTKLLVTHGPVQTVLVLSATIVFGILLGRISIGGIRFGIGGILFSGIIIGHFGFSLDPKLLVFTREFGLILFVFAVGMQVGPGFLESLRDQGLRLNFMAMFIVVFGLLMAVLCWKCFGLSIPQTAGLFSGAVTNTPALGSASEAWAQVAGSTEALSDGLRVIGMAYAVAYPFGIFGIILTMLLLRALFRINVKSELQLERARCSLQPEKEDDGRHRRDLLVTSPAALVKLAALPLHDGTGVTRVRRAGSDLIPTPDLKLRLEDRVTVAAMDVAALDKAAVLLGNNPKALNHPQMLPIFLGIFLGVFVGSLPVAVPGLPTSIKLGVAGGTLLAGIFLSRVQHFGGMTWHMTAGANLLMREIGILLFLACVGLHAGTGFVETVIHGPGFAWMGMGALITFVPLIAAALFCRLVWRISYPAICGMLAGSMTDPPALAFSMQYLGSDLPASAYATVYPLTMILRILAGQLLVLSLFGTI